MWHRIFIATCSHHGILWVSYQGLSFSVRVNKLFVCFQLLFTVCSALCLRQESFSDGKKSAVQSYLQHWFSGPQVAAILKKLTFASDQTEMLEMISPVSQA